MILAGKSRLALTGFAAAPSAADSGEDAEAAVREVYFEGFPDEVARGFDTTAIAVDRKIEVE